MGLAGSAFHLPLLINLPTRLRALSKVILSTPSIAAASLKSFTFSSSMAILTSGVGGGSASSHTRRMSLKNMDTVTGPMPLPSPLSLASRSLGLWEAA